MEKAAPVMLDTDRDKGNTVGGKGLVNIKKLSAAMRENAARADLDHGGYCAG
ncbi:hypothetical protein ABH935_001020 [Catenulispora sp. GAS73]|uniref:hypothetical protein n=1 Tax=Catenulispora sp. GAS73 TaxID=3156269 RepID=UPI003514AF62